jgi:hypothetical protein
MLAQRHEDCATIGELHDVLRRGSDALGRVGMAAGRVGKFLAIECEQRCATIDRKIQALGTDDHALAEFSRAVDRVPDHARGQHALGIVG